VTIAFRGTAPDEVPSLHHTFPLAEDGALGIRWDAARALAELRERGRGAGETLRTEMTVRATGFHTREFPVEFGTGRVAILDVELDPEDDASLGRLRLEVVDSRGLPVDAVDADLSGEAPGPNAPSTCRLSKEAPGRFVVAATPGRWTLRVRPDVPCSICGGDLNAIQPVEILAGGTGDLRVELPAYGRIFALRKERKDALPVIDVAVRSPEGTGLTRRSGERLEVFLVPAGGWKVRAGDAKEARDVVVAPGEDVTVELDE
jgi:hypothetical protein